MKNCKTYCDEVAGEVRDDAGNGEEWYPKYHESTKRFVQPILENME